MLFAFITIQTALRVFWQSLPIDVFKIGTYMKNTSHRLVHSHIIFSLLLAVLVTACSLPKFSLPNLKQQEATAIPTVVSPAQATAANPQQPEPTVASQPLTEIRNTGAIALSNFASADQQTSGLIVFTSASGDPFSPAPSTAGPLERSDASLWGISLDGSQAGQIAPASAALWPAPAAEQKGRIVDSAHLLQNPVLDAVTLPVECDPAVGGACSGYQFSPHGRSLLYFSGPDACGQALTLYDLDRQTVLQTWPRAQWAQFLDNGSIVLLQGECEKPYLYLYLPNRDTQSGLSAPGTAYWNQTQQVVLFQTQAEPAMQTGLWGINLQTSKVFLWLDQERVLQDTPIWLPDGRHVVFQHRAYQYDPVSGDAILQYPRQIVLMDAWTRSQTLLAYDARHNYALCATPGKPCNAVSGDWLKVRRTPLQKARFSAQDYDTLPAARCALFGLDCMVSEEEVLAINWKTGETLPWDEADLPEPQPLSPCPQPDLEAQPVYKDPAGAFALYTGAGGRTLWFVPQQGEPVLWVADGEGFVYLP